MKQLIDGGIISVSSLTGQYIKLYQLSNKGKQEEHKGLIESPMKSSFDYQKCGPRDAEIVRIFKKGLKNDCGNFMGISLLSIDGKIISHI